MATLNELHLQLEMKVQKFLEDESDENSSLIIAEIIRLLAMDAEVVIAGNPVEGKEGLTDPAGYYGPDGRFYFHIFTSRLRFNESGAEHPYMTKLKFLRFKELIHDILCAAQSVFGECRINFREKRFHNQLFQSRRFSR